MKQASMGKFRASLHSLLCHFKPSTTETSKYFSLPYPQINREKKNNGKYFIQMEKAQRNFKVSRRVLASVIFIGKGTGNNVS